MLTHHLESVELVGYLLDFLFLAGLFDFDARCIPVSVLDRQATHTRTMRIHHLMYLLDDAWSRDPAFVVPLSRLAASVVWSCNGRVMMSTSLIIH